MGAVASLADRSLSFSLLIFFFSPPCIVAARGCLLIFTGLSSFYVCYADRGGVHGYPLCRIYSPTLVADTCFAKESRQQRVTLPKRRRSRAERIRGLFYESRRMKLTGGTYSLLRHEAHGPRTGSSSLSIWFGDAVDKKFVLRVRVVGKCRLAQVG